MVATWLGSLPLEVDGNLVRAGVLPLVLVLVLGAVIALLYVWMRHEIKKIDVPSVGDVRTGSPVEKPENAG